MNESCCVRCNRVVAATTESYFNDDTICLECARIEQGAPRYGRAVASAMRHLAKGNYRFAGVGLSDSDRAHIFRATLQMLRGKGG